MKKEKDSELMEKVVSLCKRRGFIYPSSEIYGGIAGFWDYGHYGSLLAYNIKDLWWKHFVDERSDNYAVTTPTIMPESVWKASGHLEGFSDPMVTCSKCKHNFRADQLNGDKKCPDCGSAFEKSTDFNLMFPVSIGAGEEGTTAYLRGELAQGMFVGFKNVLDTIYPDLPFGLAQIGRAYRNEISPRDFLFRVREFDLMEFEYFIRESEWQERFEMWKEEMWRWIERVGINRDMVHEFEIPEADRAHYSKRTIDFEFDYPFGRKELYGLAYRTDYDLKKHSAESGIDLAYTDKETGERFIPHVIEPSMGHGRTMLAVLLSAYREDEMNGEKRVYLALNKEVAPVRVAVFPLLKNKLELVAKAREVFQMFKKSIKNVQFDDNGNIGKRYRRQDEIGTPHCITIDFETLENDTVTLRDRDTGEQERVKIENLIEKLR